jgi:hypothetical protein
VPRREIGPVRSPVEHDDEPDGDLRSGRDATLFEPDPADRQAEADALAESDQLGEAGAVAVLDAPTALTERESEILVFEKRWWRHAGAKEQAIREQFDLSATRYYQILNGLLDNPAALVQDPVLVGRLRRLRGSRIRARGR